MNKLKKLKLKLLSSYGLIILSVILGIGMVVVAYTDYGAPKVIVEGDYIEAPAPAEQVIEEETFGGSGGVFQTDWYKIGNRVTWIKSGQFPNATTTIISFLNPVDYGKATSTSDETYNAATHEVSTSTVMNVNLDITGAATSSMVIACGGAADAWSAPTYEIFNLTIPTSTIGVFVSGQATTTSGIGAIGTGTSDEIDYRVLLTHDYDYFTCVATGTPLHVATWTDDDIKGITGDTNTFDGYWSVEVQKNLQ